MNCLSCGDTLGSRYHEASCIEGEPTWQEAADATAFVDARFTRRSIDHHLRCSIKATGWDPEVESTDGGYLIDDHYYTPGQAVDRFVPGGWQAAYGKPCPRCDR